MCYVELIFFLFVQKTVLIKRMCTMLHVYFAFGKKSSGSIQSILACNELDDVSALIYPIV